MQWTLSLKPSTPSEEVTQPPVLFSDTTSNREPGLSSCGLSLSLIQFHQSPSDKLRVSLVRNTLERTIPSRSGEFSPFDASPLTFSHPSSSSFLRSLHALEPEKSIHLHLWRDLWTSIVRLLCLPSSLLVASRTLTVLLLRPFPNQPHRLLDLPS